MKMFLSDLPVESESYTKFGELDGARAVHVDLVDHVLDLGVGRVLPQRPHHGRQLLKEAGNGSSCWPIQRAKKVSPLFNSCFDYKNLLCYSHLKLINGVKLSKTELNSLRQITDLLS